jgi:hypothetical protein
MAFEGPETRMLLEPDWTRIERPRALKEINVPADNPIRNLHAIPAEGADVEGSISKVYSKGCTGSTVSVPEASVQSVPALKSLWLRASFSVGPE